MYKHILIPTDGSELSKKAADQGIGLAKALNAKVTAATVSEPFHIFAVEASMVTDTPAEYKKTHCRSYREISQGGEGCCHGGRCALRCGAG